MIEHEIGSMEAGKKTHRVVRQLLPGLPLSGIYKMLRVGRVRVNGRKAKGDEVVNAGDILQLRMGEEDYAVVSKPARKFAGISREVDVIHQDSDIIAVNKPAGLLVHGDTAEQKDTLANRVIAYLHDRDELDSAQFVPAPANRLDRNTSGLVLFGKHSSSARALAEAFRNHSIRKWYLALVRGTIHKSGEIDKLLERDAVKNRTFVTKSGKPALTRYQPLASSRNSTLLRIELITGRTHQIRAHMQAIGHPLLGDMKYGGGATSPWGEAGYLLHAGWLLLPKSQMSEDNALYAPLAASLCTKLVRAGYPAELLDGLRQFCPFASEQ